MSFIMEIFRIFLSLQKLLRTWKKNIKKSMSKRHKKNYIKLAKIITPKFIIKEIPGYNLNLNQTL